MRCVVCGKEDKAKNLVQINVRHKGVITKTAFVHGACYDKDPYWVQRQVKGKNPKFFVFAQKP